MSFTKIITLLAILLSSLCVQAQSVQANREPFYGRAAIKLEKGFLFIQNTKEKSFTIEVKGDAVKQVVMPNSDNPTFNIDGKIMQLVSVNNEEFVPKDKKLADKEILELHQKWETDYLNEMMKSKVVPKSEEVEISDFKSLFWYVERENYKQSFDRDCFLTRVVGETIFGLSSPIEVGGKLEDYRKLLSETMKTIKVSDKPFDIMKLAEEIKKGK